MNQPRRGMESERDSQPVQMVASKYYGSRRGKDGGGGGEKSVVKLDLQNEQRGGLDFWRRERNAERLGAGLFSLFGGVALRARTQYRWHYSHKGVCESLSVD
jgi:hypothetical protein